MARPKAGESGVLTDVELQIMNILWEIEGGTVHDVLTPLSLQTGKQYAYTSVSTMLRILEKKQVVHSEKEGRGHRYFPTIKKQKYQKKATDQLVKEVYSGQAAKLVCNLLGHAKITKNELQEIHKLLKQKGGLDE